MLVDLHMHSYFSDGTLSPEEIVAEAKQRGLKIISLTDHDDIDSYGRFKEACDKEGLIGIRGVEITTKYNDKVIHILAYGFNETEELRTLINRSKNALLETSVRLIDKMSNDYEGISSDDYKKYNYDKRKGGWKGVHYLYDRGITSELLEGAKFYKPYGCDYINFDFPSIEEVCTVVKNAGGYPVLAHPSNWYSDLSKEELFEVFTDLTSKGIEGIECFYPSNEEEMTKNCVEFCKEQDLVITAGADSHGEYTKTIKNIEYSLGIVKVELKDLNLKFLTI